MTTLRVDPSAKEPKPTIHETRALKERKLGIKALLAAGAMVVVFGAAAVINHEFDEHKHFTNDKGDVLSGALLQVYEGEVTDNTFEAIDQHGLLRYEGAVEVSGNIRTGHDAKNNLVKTIDKDESITLNNPLVVRTKDNGDWVLFVMLNNDGEPFAVYANEQGIKDYDPFKVGLLKDASKEIPDALVVEPVLPTPQS